MTDGKPTRRVPRPRAPTKPWGSSLSLCRLVCEQWGIDFEPFKTGSRFPCTPCKGGTSPPEHTGLDYCPYCVNEPGFGDRYQWQGFLAAQEHDWQKIRRAYEKQLAIHMSIKRKCTPAEKDYLDIE